MSAKARLIKLEWQILDDMLMTKWGLVNHNYWQYKSVNLILNFSYSQIYEIEDNMD